MAGIISFGAYVPIWRLGEGTKDWGSKAERSVTNFDEDTLTMSVAAAADCLAGLDRKAVDGLYVASTTFPYGEKQAASTVATAGDLGSSIFTSDVGNSLRAGTIAFKMAMDSVKAGSGKRVLVTAADVRLGASRSDIERNGGDGAAAFLFGDTGEAATIDAQHAVVNEIIDNWRPEGETGVRSWEDRFVFQEGYLKAVGQCVTELLQKTGLKMEQFDKVILYAPDARRHAEAVRLIKADPKKVQDPLFGKLGNTGAAFALMQLVTALEEAQPNQRFLVVNYGDGADALVVHTTAKITEVQKLPRRGMKGFLASKKAVPDYADYLKWRGMFSADSGVRRPAGGGPSPAALYREQAEVLRFQGVKCNKCATVQYPPQRVCTICHEKDNFTPIRLSDSKAKLFTYSMDYIAGTPDVPLVISVLDFAAGGRAVLMMTDRDTKEVKIDMNLELTFRKLRLAGGIHNYYWKAMPVR
ncbi:MAG: 3-hydroxy-3-methylglutaryl CoA synthase [Dehalococcoidia bacterium]|nr:3-hydroxy-3-methylglutaryl CoA synthase [Dehalococcoidia bacterium]